MSSVKAILLKPLDGFAEGSEREFDQVDFDRLVGMGAVKAAGQRGEKSADTADNKMAPAAANKAAPAAKNKSA